MSLRATASETAVKTSERRRRCGRKDSKRATHMLTLSIGTLLPISRSWMHLRANEEVNSAFRSSTLPTHSTRNPSLSYSSRYHGLSPAERQKTRPPGARA